MTTVDLQSRSEIVTPETCLPLTLYLIVGSQHKLYNSYIVDLYCCAELSVISSLAIISLGKR